MHIKATGQITLSAAFFQWPTTATNGRAESRNAFNACWLEIPLASCDRVSLQRSYLSLVPSLTIIVKGHQKRQASTKIDSMQVAIVVLLYR